MNFNTVNPYLNQLIKSGHLEVLQFGKRTFYQATERGRELEKSLRDILDNLET